MTPISLQAATCEVSWLYRCGRFSPAQPWAILFHPPDPPIALQSITRDAPFSRSAMAIRMSEVPFRPWSRMEQVAEPSNDRAMGFTSLEQRGDMGVFTSYFSTQKIGFRRSSPGAIASNSIRVFMKYLYTSTAWAIAMHILNMGEASIAGTYLCSDPQGNEVYTDHNRPGCREFTPTPPNDIEGKPSAKPLQVPKRRSDPPPTSSSSLRKTNAMTELDHKGASYSE